MKRNEEAASARAKKGIADLRQSDDISVQSVNQADQTHCSNKMRLPKWPPVANRG